MKRTLTLVLLLMSSILLFSSCQKDEDLIVGTWNVDLYRSSIGGYPLTEHGFTFFQFTFYEDGFASVFKIEEEREDRSVFHYQISDGKLYQRDENTGVYNHVATIGEISKEKLILTGGHDNYSRFYYVMTK